jgi:hypothetical protein
MYHEVHNEIGPTPTELANKITAWVHARLDTGGAASRGMSGQGPSPTGTAVDTAQGTGVAGAKL